MPLEALSSVGGLVRATRLQACLRRLSRARTPASSRRRPPCSLRRRLGWSRPGMEFPSVEAMPASLPRAPEGARRTYALARGGAHWQLHGRWAVEPQARTPSALCSASSLGVAIAWSTTHAFRFAARDGRKPHSSNRLESPCMTGERLVRGSLGEPVAAVARGPCIWPFPCSRVVPRCESAVAHR
jgi:hypothetical protein